ncbi:TrmH family RNA methyltransferase [Gillisia sp. M10.2A]|uniref:TrmH family RNA methyltransferase n=1 Tax=Gillisia lutea TaxID=2909668 RepID=A0ABS9EJJ5_9FLAO|nr:TrmH family RNA methyltransferase [Gillisia lutea]MCF4101626.1 TrmH family RNA methyltransferase [Gillisia lutea]
MSKQLTHEEHTLTSKKFPLIILTDNLMGDANIGSLFRLADAFNIEKIIFTGTPINIQSNRLKRTARGTYQVVNFEHHEEASEIILQLKQKEYKIYGLEITSHSIPLGDAAFQNEDKIVLILGNEKFGISEDVLNLTDTQIHIPMFGKNSSMNVSQAAGIALYEITKTLPSFEEK